MGGKNFVGSFSYHVSDSEVIDECMKLAKTDGISFSEFVVACLKEQVRKKGVGDKPNAIGVLYNLYDNETKKSSQSDLREWLPQKQAFIMAKKQHLTSEEWKHLGNTCHIIATKVRTGYL